MVSKEFDKRNAIRNFVLVFLAATLAFMYSLTIGLDRSSIPIGADGNVDLERAGWQISFLNLFYTVKTVGDVEVAVNQLIFFVSVFLAIAAFAQGIFFNRLHETNVKQLKELFPVDFIPVHSVGREDIQTMTNYYQGADFVTVFSGDFSWLANDSAITKEVERLARAKKIRFHSSRDRTDVSAAIGREKLDTYLPLFNFSSPAGFKASLVQMQGGRQYLLYNRRETPQKGEIIVFENRSSLAEPISRLSHFVRQLKEPHLVIFVCGETGSGKTKVARQIQAASNGQLLPVGDYFRQLTEAVGLNHNDRNVVISVGWRFLDRFGPEDLARVLISKFDLTKRTVVIDGLRSPGSVDYIRSRFPNYLVVYVDASMKVRVERCKGFDLNAMDQSIDTLVRSVADLPMAIRIENTHGSLDDLRSAVENEVIRRFDYLSKQ